MHIDDVKKFDQKISLIFHAVIAGPLILYCFTYLETLGGDTIAVYGEPSTTLKLFVSISSGILVYLAFYFYRKELRVARGFETLEEKFKKLFSASIIHYALLELASIIAALAFFLTHDHLFTAVYVFILFLMSLNRPTPRKYIRDLHLRGEERDIVLNKKPS
ncbi:MAG: hypothetical protein ACNS60_15285 [Candidatus Cyclobacteriaceae bacterium M2_1C_046]